VLPLNRKLSLNAFDLTSPIMLLYKHHQPNYMAIILAAQPLTPAALRVSAWHEYRQAAEYTSFRPSNSSGILGDLL